MSVHEDTLQGLNEALEYVKGDTSKGRSMVISIPDDVIDFYNIFEKLSESNKRKAMQYVSELLQASSG